jgi:hypothetical protein
MLDAGDNDRNRGQQESATMRLRQFVQQGWPRIMSTLALTVLASGIVVAVVAVSRALATALNPRVGPSFSPDLTVSAWKFGPLDVGERAMIPVDVANAGASTASPVRVLVHVGPGFVDASIKSSGFTSQDLGVGGAGERRFICTAPNLDGGESLRLTVIATVQSADLPSRWLRVQVDPDNLVHERRETNNTDLQTY